MNVYVIEASNGHVKRISERRQVSRSLHIGDLFDLGVRSQIARWIPIVAATGRWRIDRRRIHWRRIDRRFCFLGNLCDPNHRVASLWITAQCDLGHKGCPARHEHSPCKTISHLPVHPPVAASHPVAA
jgi:hypothetical protein